MKDNPSSRPSVTAQLEAAGLLPNRKLGQNFLIDQNYLSRIAELAAEKPEDAVLEIGAGLGALTNELAASGQSITAIEIDRGLHTLLEATFSENPNVHVVLGDILKTNIADLYAKQNFQVIANIPYYLTSKLIRQLLEADTRPSLIHLLVQKEVAERACQNAPKMNLLSLSIRLFGEAEKLFAVPAGAFFPVPKVDSAVLKITPSKAPIGETVASDLMRLARAAFQQKRKTLLNSLSALPEWDKSEVGLRIRGEGIDPGARPQHLEMEQWLALARAFS
jgi:16S rRNA (adenine1518-N6/adenine1519-N6)-dimethyltransferase